MQRRPVKYIVTGTGRNARKRRLAVGAVAAVAVVAVCPVPFSWPTTMLCDANKAASIFRISRPLLSTLFHGSQFYCLIAVFCLIANLCDMDACVLFFPRCHKHVLLFFITYIVYSFALNKKSSNKWLLYFSFFFLSLKYLIFFICSFFNY